ncbi:hypothetical protein [Phaeobacter sp. NW0010-22]|uniref:hypothetical protein n=1 Tax=Phaeobacter sp. NW0010-22 TaxID=3135907 RepID=UPI00310814D0
MIPRITAYLDQGIYSKIRNIDHSWLGKTLIELGALPVFSDAHLTEMQNSGRPEEFAKVLEELNACYLRNPGAYHNSYHPIASFDIGQARARLASHTVESENYLKAFLPMLHHMLGGLRKTHLTEIATGSSAEIKSLVDSLLAASPDPPSENDLEKIKASILATEKNLLEWDIEKDKKSILKQREAVRKGDVLQGLPPLEKIDFLLSFLDEDQRTKFISIYPPSFALKRPLKNGEVTGFAFTLFGLGLIHDRKMYTGPRQEQRFAAQYRDAWHIEEASRCDIFLTADEGAFELAKATYAYSGFPTKVACLKFP